MRRIDMTGRRVGRLVVVQLAGRKRTNALWLCRCDCGASHIVEGRLLRSGQTRSCGCLRVESSTQRMTTMRERNSSMARSVGGYYRRMRALTDVFPERPDTVHVDRPGARVIRGGRY